MNWKSLLLWSAVFSGLMVMASGYFAVQSSSIWGGQSVSFGVDAVYAMKDALAHASMAGGGSYTLEGLSLQSGVEILPQSLFGDNADPVLKDYRFIEFNPTYRALSPEGMVFSCSVEGVTCSNTNIRVDKTVRLDAHIICRPNESVLDCTISLTPSTQTLAVLPVYPRPKDAALADSLDFAESESHRFEGLQPSAFSLTGVYSGAYSSLLVSEILDLARFGVMLNVAEGTAFGFDANQKYGIPFFDGTTTAQDHLRYLLAHAQSPQPIDVSNPTLVQIHEAYTGYHPLQVWVEGQVDPIPVRSFFDQSLDALLYPSTRTIYDQSRGIDALNHTTGGIFWERRNLGTLRDQIRRLETLYVIQNGFSVEQKEQQLANVIRWMDVHENLTSVSILTQANKGDVFDANAVSVKSGDATVRFDSAQSTDFGTDAIRVSLSRAEVSKNLRFYWIVGKGVLKNQYSVAASRTSALQAPTP